MSNNTSPLTDVQNKRKSDVQEKRINHMEYLPGMEIIDSDIGERVMLARENYNPHSYTAEDVIYALEDRSKTPEDFAALLSPVAMPYLEEMAKLAKKETMRHFGTSTYLFTPLYISNYCENHCIYCGFNRTNNIRRAKLTEEQIALEMKAIAATGLEEVLILTGESRHYSDIEYIGNACREAKKYFKNIGLEIYPLNTDEYAYLRECGADYVTVFQETYNPDKYETLHLAGHKRIFPYRLNAQERALRGGMRGVAFAALLGLDDYRRDAFATGMHAYFLQRKYPHAEISFSCPRLRPIVNNESINPKDVHEPNLLQIMLAYRIFMPFAGMTISTRERAEFRDNVIGLCATKISAGVSTGIGAHSDDENGETCGKSAGSGDDQFEIADDRNVDEVIAAIRKKGLQPVMNDYILV